MERNDFLQGFACFFVILVFSINKIIQVCSYIPNCQQMTTLKNQAPPGGAPVDTVYMETKEGEEDTGLEVEAETEPGLLSKQSTKEPFSVKAHAYTLNADDPNATQGRLAIWTSISSTEERKDIKEGTPLDLVCVIDTSGSMANEAVIKNKAGAAESDGLSQLDLVQHAIRAILHSMGPSDRVSLVSFSGGAKVVSPLCYMDDDHKASTLQRLASLRAEGGTNLWAGIQEGIRGR